MNETYFDAGEPTSFEMLAEEQEEQQPLEMHSDIRGIIRDYDVLKNIPSVDDVPIYGDITRSGKYTDKTPTEGSRKLLASETVKKALDKKQDKLIIDTLPTKDSNNPISSGGVYGALQDTSVEFLTNMEIEELFKNFSKGV